MALGKRAASPQNQPGQSWSKGTIFSEKRLTTKDCLPEPEVLGLPGKYKDWRRMQQMAVLATEMSEKRFVLQCAPTGFGKSLVYMANAKLVEGGKKDGEGRTIILTSTKGLQDQLKRDFGRSEQELGSDSGISVDVRGQNAYTCIKAGEFGLSPDTSVSDAPCHVGVACQERQGKCHYFSAVERARGSNVVVTNYAYWLYATNHGEGLGEFDLMVLDEAHDCPDILSDFLSVELSEQEIKSLGTTALGQGCTPEEWRQWAGFHADRLTAKLDAVKMETRSKANSPGGFKSTMTRTLKDLEKLLDKLTRLRSVDENWVVEHAIETIGAGVRARKEKVMHFNPLWPDKYAESTLFQGVKKVVMFSATVRPKTAQLLGLGPADCDFNEYPSTFPVARRPVIHVPTIKVGFKTTEAEMAVWMSRIDEIIRTRQDRKGIIHTVSFKRRNYITQNSMFRSMMLSNDSRNTRDVVQQFKNTSSPMVLVSPSMTTGWDFPYTECEYQIIGKIMFPDTQSGVMKARQQTDRDYSSYIAMQNLVQASGRGMRAEDDQCETFILDDNIGWFMSKYKEFAPKWWREALTTSLVVPKPLPSLIPF